MSTPIASITRPGRRVWAVATGLVVAGALAAGCGTASVSSTSAGTGAGPSASGGTAAGGTAGGSAGSTAGSTAAGGTATSGPTSGPTASPAPSSTAAPVPTVSGGHVAAGEVACAGWPASAPSASLPVSFVPVKVERCVNGAETIPGKGLWATATLQQANGDLAALISALRQPSTGHKPGTVCPALAEIPPAVLLISGTGQMLIPRLPVSGCGITSSQVLLALETLHWQPVSVRLVSQISAAGTTAQGTTGPGTTMSGTTVSGTPRALQTVGAGS